MSLTAKKWLARLGLLLLLALGFWARTYNREDVFQSDGRIYFIEGDCYSRMQRAKMVCEGHWIIKQHDFENYPAGTTPHTTAPMDYAIVALKIACDGVLGILDSKGTSALSAQTLDLAGALISPILATLTALWLWWWAGWMRLPYRGAMIFFFAVSPIMVHGTELGRPDHQSLVILLISIAVGAEFALTDFRTAARTARRWALVAGVAWGLALWTSLYEPAVFFGGAVAWHLLSNRAALTARTVRARWVALGAIMLGAVLIDGWRLTWPDETLKQYFTAWASTIGELKTLSLTSGLIWEWMGMLWISAPFLLWLAGREDMRARGLLPLWAAMLALTMWQLRWGYFIALAVTISIPWQLALFRQRWLGWFVAVVAMLPLIWGWASLLNLDNAERKKKEHSNAVAKGYRNVAEVIRNSERQPFLAPWWASPQIAYWSGQPGVAGTSHQSIAGIVDSARVLVAATPEEAASILRARKVHWVIIDDTAFSITRRGEYAAPANGAEILGIALPNDAMGSEWARNPRRAPAYLQFVTPDERGLVYSLSRWTAGKLETTSMQFYDAQWLKLYRVIPDKL